jgi:hypothetical protein
MNSSPTDTSIKYIATAIHEASYSALAISYINNQHKNACLPSQHLNHVYKLFYCNKNLSLFLEPEQVMTIWEGIQ